MEVEYYKGDQYKRFMVFDTVQYYPCGGLYDCSGSFDTLREAEDYMKKRKEDKYKPEDLSLFDREVGKYVITKYEV